MLQKAAIGFGAVFVLIGVLGFVPGVTTQTEAGTGLLLGIFEVNTLHNLVHLSSGLVALVASARVAWSRLYFQIFGVVYALVTVLGMISESDPVLGILPVNIADNILHIVIATTALYLGFVYKERDEVKTAL